MTFDSTLHLGDVIISVIALGLLPAMKLLISTLLSLQKSMDRVQLVLFGSVAEKLPGLVYEVTRLVRAEDIREAQHDRL